MNHIDPKRLPYVTRFSCVSTAASDSPATWSAIPCAKVPSAVACHVSGTGNRGRNYWRQVPTAYRMQSVRR
jgi:hypothetical protein